MTILAREGTTRPGIRVVGQSAGRRRIQVRASWAAATAGALL